MTILTKPEGLCLSGKLPKLVLSSGEPVRVQLQVGGIGLLDETYTPDGTGRIALDLSEAVRNALSFTIPTSDTFVQPALCRAFTLLLNGDTHSFTAIRAGVKALSITAEEFLKANFLTWQEQQKRVSYSQPEWLTYYAPVSAYLYATAHFSDGTSEHQLIAALPAGTATTVNMQFGRLAALFAQQPVYIDAYVTAAGSPTATRLSYVQRYILAQAVARSEQLYCFENSLGGMDSIRCTGEAKTAPEYSPETALMGDSEQTFFVEKKDVRSQNTGWLSRTAATWLQDMFAGGRCYRHDSGALQPIVIDEVTAETSTMEDLTAFEFTYRPAVASPYLNVVRDYSVLPELLDLVDPEGTLFF